MASFIKLSTQTRNIVNESCERKHESDVLATFNHRKAVVIQSWYRGIRVRRYISFLTKSAVMIQRQWRGFMGRRFFSVLVQKTIMMIRMNFYNSMAVRIQNVWRGFYVRKHVHNFYARKLYLDGLVIKNKIIRCELQEYKEQIDSHMHAKKQEERKKRQLIHARNHHYLVSTIQKPGIYNSPYRPFSDEREFQLREAKALLVVESKKKVKKSRKMDGTLPPLKVGKVYSFKPESCSLRVATDFNSLEQSRRKMKDEEWKNRVIDEPFLPFSRKKLPYKKELHSQSKYGHLPYGMKYFREENPNLNVSLKRMQTFVPPIPLFDQLTKT